MVLLSENFESKTWNAAKRLVNREAVGCVKVCCEKWWPSDVLSTQRTVGAQTLQHLCLVLGGEHQRLKLILPTKRSDM